MHVVYVNLNTQNNLQHRLVVVDNRVGHVRSSRKNCFELNRTTTLLRRMSLTKTRRRCFVAFLLLKTANAAVLARTPEREFLRKLGQVYCYVPVFVSTTLSINQRVQQKDQAATYIAVKHMTRNDARLNVAYACCLRMTSAGSYIIFLYYLVTIFKPHASYAMLFCQIL